MYHLFDALRALAEAAPAPTPTPAPTLGPPQAPNLDTGFGGIKSVLQWGVAPVIGVVVGILIMSRSRLGEMSKALTTAAIAFVGILFVGGAVTFIAWGDDILALFGQ